MEFSNGITVTCYRRFPEVADWIEEHGESWESGLASNLGVQVEYDTKTFLDATLTTDDFSEWVTRLFDVFKDTTAFKKDVYDVHDKVDLQEFIHWLHEIASELKDAEVPGELTADHLEYLRNACRILVLEAVPVDTYRLNGTYSEREALAAKHTRSKGYSHARTFLRCVREGIDSWHWHKIATLHFVSGGYTYNAETALSGDFSWDLYTDSGDFYGDALVFVDGHVYVPYSSRETAAFLDYVPEWCLPNGKCMSSSELRWVPKRWLEAHLGETTDDFDFATHGRMIVHLEDGDPEEAWVVIHAGREANRPTPSNAAGPSFYGFY